MSISSVDNRKSITRSHRDLLLVASVLTYLLVTLGGIVCVTDSSRGCPDWPACYGQLIPPIRLDSILEYTHRVMAALTTLCVVASALVGLRKSRSVRWVAWLPLIAVLFLLAVSALGAMVVLRGLEPWSSHPQSLPEAVAAGTSLHLAPGESLSSWLVASVYTGGERVARVCADGRVERIAAP